MPHYLLGSTSRHALMDERLRNANLEQQNWLSHCVIRHRWRTTNKRLWLLSCGLSYKQTLGRALPPLVVYTDAKAIIDSRRRQ